MTTQDRKMTLAERVGAEFDLPPTIAKTNKGPTIKRANERTDELGTQVAARFSEVGNQIERIKRTLKELADSPRDTSDAERAYAIADRLFDRLDERMQIINDEASGSSQIDLATVEDNLKNLETLVAELNESLSGDIERLEAGVEEAKQIADTAAADAAKALTRAGDARSIANGASSVAHENRAALVSGADVTTNVHVHHDNWDSAWSGILMAMLAAATFVIIVALNQDVSAFTPGIREMFVALTAAGFVSGFFLEGASMTASSRVNYNQLADLRQEDENVGNTPDDPSPVSDGPAPDETTDDPLEDLKQWETQDEANKEVSTATS